MPFHGNGPRLVPQNRCPFGRPDLPAVYNFPAVTAEEIAAREPLEPAHVHITKAGSNAKFWLSPAVKLAYNYGFNARTLSELEKMVVANHDELERAWHDYFGAR
jgi:Domain of unknown function (DUF4160)